MIELRTLGTLELNAADGRPLDSVLAQPRRTALLCYLALARPLGFHSRDTLYALFWPEDDAKQARHSLRQALYFLRRALGSNAIVSRGDDALALAPDQVQCDAWEFERAVEEERLETALALYRGDLLTGFHVSGTIEFERWLDSERSRLRQRAAAAAWAYVDTQERAGQRARAAEWANHAAAFNPADETTIRRLILLLDRLGERSAALRAYQTFASNLEREYELEPSAETRALVARIGAATEEPLPVLEPSSTPQAARRHTPVPSPQRNRPARKPTTLARRAVPFGAVALLLAASLIFVWMRDRGTSAAAPSTQELAREVAKELRMEPGECVPTRGRPTTANVVAHDFYRRGNDPAATRTDSGIVAAREHLQQAIAADSTFAAAYARLALLHERLSVTRRNSDEYIALIMSAEEDARKALQLDNSLADAHVVFGDVRMRQLDFATAEREFNEAIDLAPTCAQVRLKLAELYVWTGRPRDALREARHALQLEPVSPSADVDVAHMLMVNGKYDEALEQLERVAELKPPLLRTAVIKAQIYAAQQMWDPAVAAVRAQAENGDAPLARALLGYALGRAGNLEEANRVLADLLDRAAQSKGWAFQVAATYAGLDDLENAFLWLNRSLDDYSLHVMIMEPTFAQLRRDARFQRVRERLQLPAQ